MLAAETSIERPSGDQAISDSVQPGTARQPGDAFGGVATGRKHNASGPLPWRITARTCFLLVGANAGFVHVTPGATAVSCAGARLGRLMSVARSAGPVVFTIVLPSGLQVGLESEATPKRTTGAPVYPWLTTIPPPSSKARSGKPAETVVLTVVRAFTLV